MADEQLDTKANIETRNTIQSNPILSFESGFADASTPYSTGQESRFTKTVEFNQAMQCSIDHLSMPDGKHSEISKTEEHSLESKVTPPTLTPLLTSVPMQTYKSPSMTDTACQSEASSHASSCPVHTQTDLTEVSINCQTEQKSHKEDCAQTILPTTR